MCDMATFLQKNLTMDASVEERRGLKRKMSLTSCEICDTAEAKYRCPNCLKCSCSLACVKQHKLRSGCNGIRDRTAFISLSHFTDLNLLSDYRLLEETGRIADRPNRDSLLHTRTHHTYCVMLLLKNAKAAKVNLKILPKSFSRRRENKSIYNKTERKLYWHLKLFFSQSDAVYTDRVPEDKVLEGILSDYFHPAESDPIKQQKLKMYVVAPRDQIYVFMKSEQRLPNSLKYHELDVKKTIRENLMFKTVVEYPEFHVVLKGHDEEYRTQVSGQSIFSSRPPSSEAPGVLQSHMVRPGKETTAQSELEDGELRSDVDDDRDDDGDGDDDDKQENRNVSCHVSHGEVDENEEEEDNCTSEDKSLIKVLKDP